MPGTNSFNGLGGNINNYSFFEYTNDNDDLLGFNTISNNNNNNNSNNDYFSRAQICFSDIQFNGRSESFDAYYPIYSEFDSTKIYAQLISISAEYYKYIKSIVLYKSSNDNLFSEPVQVYSNVQNGFGIVLGRSKFTVSIARKGQY